MGKELVFQALRHQPVERAPWVPFCGVHAGFLKGYSAKEVLQDADKLIESLHEVHQTYAPDGMPVVFDLQIEAEILGCQLTWVNDSPPMVSTHPLAADKKIPCDCTLPEEEDGRLPMILQVMREMKASIGDTTALYGLITGPFTLASHLRGTDLFLDMYDDPEFVNGLLDYCAQVACRMASLYIAAGMDVIAIVDPLVSQISEEHFTEFLYDPYTSIFTDLRNQDIFSSFFVCGDATRNIEAMCLCAPDNISIDENIDIKAAKQICDKHNVTIGGNIQLTVTMLHGSQQANMQAVLNIVDACGTQNLIVSPGCDMPYATPPENVIAASFAIHQPDQARGMLEGYDSSLDLSDINVTLPEYSQLVRPLVEVFTLDSQSCAACGYMMSMAQSVVQEMGDVFDLVEYKFTVKENIKRCVEMKVKNLPSLYLNGQLLYSSLIPNQNELIEAIRRVM